jgi:hypothetical protein
MKRGTITIRVFLCNACRRIFRTVKNPKKCDRCGSNDFTFLGKYKQRKSNFRRRRRRRWINPGDLYEKREIFPFKRQF